MTTLFRHLHISTCARSCVKTMLVWLVVMPVHSAPLDPPTPAVVAEAKRIVEEMVASPRGPYSRIRWYCNDGTVLPPEPYACREHGGGRQHAEYSAARRQLAGLGWSVGTIFAALSFDELFHSLPRQQRLREIPLERYLIDIDAGWVLKRARGYRGRVQAEDENDAGKNLLVSLLSNNEWLDDNFLLVREAARAIPHGRQTDLVQSVRRQATQLAELDRAADAWRAEIHADPDATTGPRLRAWAKRQVRPEVATLAMEIADKLDQLFGNEGRRARLAVALAGLGKSPAAAAIRADVEVALGHPPLVRVQGLCRSMSVARARHMETLEPQSRLALVDALRDLETEVLLAYSELDVDSLSRRQLLELGGALLHCSYASGLLSAHELQLLSDALPANADGEITVAEYAAAVQRLKRVPGWAIGTIRYTFAEALSRYTALDPRAARFSDDLLRGSAMWPLGSVLKALSRDVDALAGTVVEIAGTPVGGAVALNNGVGRGTLRIFDTVESLEQATVTRSHIAVVPETIAELSPLAGILTLGEGNALSHVQLLARNFGIPNVAIDYDTLRLLRPLENHRVLLVVTTNGNVLLEADNSQATTTETGVLNNVRVPLPDLEVRRIVSLDELSRKLSGKVVGPKAANLGELNRLFPGRVAPALAIPFGVYAAHLDAAGLGSRISAAFASHASGDTRDEDFNTEIAAIRRAIGSLELDPQLREQLLLDMRKAFGEPGTYGVFVRSDTNVEDLPQFTGAGLNETVPHLVDAEQQLAAIPRVWSSVLSPRALAWRSSVLAEPDKIYASVLLMKSVPATKSGVLVTTNLARRGAPGMTASTAWGVGGAVAGEAAETLVIGADSVEVISEAKSPYRRQLLPEGGVGWLPAPAGTVLQAAEIEQLRQLARSVARKYEAVYDDNGVERPWDIEFGFVDGELTLFQIRPLVERSTPADQVLASRRPGKLHRAGWQRQVALDAVPFSENSN